MILRFVLRVFCLPMLVVLSVLCVMFDMALRLFCWAASLLYWFLFICMLIAVCNNLWINIGILSAMFVGLVCGCDAYCYIDARDARGGEEGGYGVGEGAEWVEKMKTKQTILCV